MKTLRFEVEILAPRPRVAATMIDPQGYAVWAAPFSEGSHYEGSWAEGAAIRFTADGGHGMQSVVETHRPAERVTVRHLGMYGPDGPDTGEASRDWNGARETFAYADVAGGCRVTVTVDVPPAFEDWMQQTYPNALARLKAACEAGTGD